MERDVRQGESSLIIGRSGVFSGTEEEKESDTDYIGQGTLRGRWSVAIVSQIEQKGNECDWYGSHSSRGRIEFSIVSKLTVDTKVGLPCYRRDPWVRGPHPLERLAHRTQGCLYCTMSDQFLAGSNSSLSVTVGKDLQNGDRICETA